MMLKEFLENIGIDEEWKVQYYTSENADIVVVCSIQRKMA